MAYLDNLFGPHAQNLQNALGRTSQRHSLLTENLSNVNTPGYKRKDLDFNIILEQELRGQTAGSQAMRDRAEQRRSASTSIRVDGNNVDLEREVMSVAETELRYQALTDMTGRYFSGLKNVIREGR